MMAVNPPIPLPQHLANTMSPYSTYSGYADSPYSSNNSSRRSFPSAQNPPSRPSSNNDSLMPLPPANSDPTAPSPVTSDVGTDFADVDEEVEETTIIRERPSSTSTRASTFPFPKSELKIDTINSPQSGQEDGEPQSVIHAPSGYKTFQVQRMPSQKSMSEPVTTIVAESGIDRPSSTATVRERDDEAGSTVSTVGPSTVKEQAPKNDSPVTPAPLQTMLPPDPEWTRTPRAQTRQEFHVPPPASRPGSSLSSINEGDADESKDFTSGDEGAADYSFRTFYRDYEAEIRALQTALTQCWTFCSTLASLSYVHRERVFGAGRGVKHEQAWESCWRLCQNLYNTREQSATTSVRPTLDLVREFCQALFDVRARDNETSDSVLRVSFELNNHLFNTHDRTLPEVFRERTLDFYITLCHRLMKQKLSMPEEPDALLRACWSLAEMLFSIRQNNREGRRADEELLVSAIQACWDLCDLFREGWAQIRPERGTPRPSQTTFTQAFLQAQRQGLIALDDNGNPLILPETPTTIFEDTVTTFSPEEATAPNIMILNADTASTTSGTSSLGGRQRASRSSNNNAGSRHRWPSSSSSRTRGTLSERGGPSKSTVSTETIKTPAEDAALVLLRVLFVRAAVATKRGYSQNSSDSNLNNLYNFARNLPDTAFGSTAWQIGLMDHYRETIINDTNFRNLGVAATIGEHGRLNPIEIARAVRGMTMAVNGFSWLGDLFRFVFGYYVEDALKSESNGEYSIKSSLPDSTSSVGTGISSGPGPIVINKANAGKKVGGPDGRSTPAPLAPYAHHE